MQPQFVIFFGETYTKFKKPPGMVFVMKNTLLSLSCAAALFGSAAPAFASSTFHLVVPLGARTQVQEPADPITVSLAGGALPTAMVNQAYSDSLLPYLSVTGDVAFEPAAARWRLADGALPAGLVLNEVTGEVAGTPTAKTTSPASFTVLATYKGSDGQAVYLIEVASVTLKVREISASHNTCALTEAGGVVCWGYNNYGQLGNNSKINSATPVSVVGLESGVQSISTGGYHGCAVMNTGLVKCWGRNDYGELGDSSTTSRLTPVTVANLSSVARVAAGWGGTCAITTTGAAKCWGLNTNGQVGDGSTATIRTQPVAVSGLSSGVVSISLASRHACAVTSAGAAKCWGANGAGQLGDNSTFMRLAPINVSGLGSGVKAIAVGTSHTCALMHSGALKCWGSSQHGQLGGGDTATIFAPGPDVALGSTASSVSLGEYHTCAVTTEGSVKCWGLNNYGQLGDGGTTNRSIPVEVAALGTNVSEVSLGYYSSCVKTKDGQAKCWGSNSVGGLGDGSFIDRSEPVDVQPAP